MKTQFVIKFSVLKSGYGVVAETKCNRFKHTYPWDEYFKQLMGSDLVLYFYGWNAPGNYLYIENDVRLERKW